MTGAPIENALPPAVAPPLAGSSARVTSAQTDLLTVALPSQKAARNTKAKKLKVSEAKPNNQSARLNSSQASARLQIKTSGKGKQESWTVKTTAKPSTKGRKQTSFRVRLSDVGFRVCLVYYDGEETRRERYLCYLSASEWKEAKRGNLSSFVQIVTDKLAERATKEDADGEKLDDLSRRVRAFL